MLMILLFGIVFGLILQYARLNRFDTISGLAVLENLTVVKAIALAIGVGILLLQLEVGLGYATFHVKSFQFVGLLLGGLIFGSGMAILGYCPGTLPISLGEGSVDAFLGILGGLLGGLIYTLALPELKPLLGADSGKLFLNASLGSGVGYYLVSSLAALAFIAIAVWLQRVDKVKDKKWIVAGILLAVLNSIIMLSAVSDRPIGASTAFPYAADRLLGLTGNSYFEKITASGSWQIIFLGGAFLSALIVSLSRGKFKLVLMHENWRKFKGDSSLLRVVWSVVGGILLIFGARMAGGCTSGHILSGGMQLAYSSLLFAVFTFAGLLLVGRVFYR